jgi:PAS domain S-box-containing protein
MMLQVMDSARSTISGRPEDDAARLLIDQILEYGVVVLEADGRIVSCNAGASRILGCDRRDLVGQSFETLYLPEDIANNQPARDLAAARACGEVRREGWHARADGTRYWADVVLRRLSDESGAARGFGCILRDDTTRHHHDSFRRSILDSTVDAIVSCDGQGRIVFFNRTAERMFGYAADQAVGRPISLLMLEHDRARHDELLAAFARTGQGSILDRVREVVGCRCDGTAFPMELAVTRFHVDGQPIFTAVCRDLTCHRGARGQLNQAQKMEAMGQLAGGIAHDFNNLLMIVAGYCEGLRSSMASDDSRLPALEQIALAAEKASSLTAQLLAFSRNSVEERRVLDLNEILTRTTELLRRTIGEDVMLEMDLDPALPRVHMDEGHIEQILINLAVNARDAMPQGGRLTIRTAVMTLDGGHALARVLPPGQYARLEVSDSGTGMTAAVKARAFEPFFTTKARGQGTGLGLATVYGIVRQSGGHIEIISEPGHGTTFQILLPAVASTGEAPAAAPVDTPPAVAKGGETILVVEDEPAVRDIVVSMLQALGYRVHSAARPDDAIRIAEMAEGRIDALITDVVMPGIGGRQLVEQLWLLRPDLRVIFMSGYTDDAMLRHGVAHADVSFLQKPFTKKMLARKLREVLDRA